MNPGTWSEERVAGSFLLGSLLVLVLAGVIMVASGALRGFPAMVKGSLAEAAPYAATFRVLILLFAIGWIVQLLGLGLLTRLLARAGAGQLAVLAFMLVLVAVIVGFLYSTFRMSVEVWAAQEAARTGSLPEFFEPLKAWVSDSFRVAYRAHLIAVAVFGLALLRTRLLSQSVAWATIGFSVLFLVMELLIWGAPAVPFLVPAAIGVALLRK